MRGSHYPDALRQLREEIRDTGEAEVSAVFLQQLGVTAEDLADRLVCRVLQLADRRTYLLLAA